jgi:hypothetical protein
LIGMSNGDILELDREDHQSQSQSPIQAQNPRVMGKFSRLCSSMHVIGASTDKPLLQFKAYNRLQTIEHLVVEKMVFSSNNRFIFVLFKGGMIQKIDMETLGIVEKKVFESQVMEVHFLSSKGLIVVCFLNLVRLINEDFVDVSLK